MTRTLKYIASKDISTLGRYDFGLFLNFNSGKQILPCVVETKKFGLIWGHVGGV